MLPSALGWGRAVGVIGPRFGGRVKCYLNTVDVTLILELQFSEISLAPNPGRPRSSGECRQGHRAARRRSCLQGRGKAMFKGRFVTVGEIAARQETRADARQAASDRAALLDAAIAEAAERHAASPSADATLKAAAQREMARRQSCLGR